MLYNLLLPYINDSHIANLVHYLTFRSMMAALLSMVWVFAFGPAMIRLLAKLQKFGQPIRDDGPESHIIKAGTPTMGGLIIIGSIITSSLLFADLRSIYVWTSLFVLVSFGMLGFMDDYLKVTQNNTKGVRGKMKLLVQFLVAFIACYMVQAQANEFHISHISVPYMKNMLIDIGYFYLPFAAFVIVGSSNAVNLTDGLDGLAIVLIGIVAACFGVISYLAGNIVYANYLQIIYVPNVSELTVICGSMVGGAIGFLWFNSQPAEIFMGDTGSLSLGGILGIISVVTKHEMILAIIGGVFVIETLSVVIQVYYFKYTGGRRFFKMAPIHHHFEKAGWSEAKVVVRFWILGIIFAIIGMASLKLR